MRRRQRRLRAQWRHEQQSVATALAAVLHHSAGPSKKVVERRERQEEEVHETHVAPQGQRAPPLGTRPGLPPEPAPQGRVGQHSGIGYVRQMVEQPVDASALAVFEEAEAKDLEVECMELVRSGFHKSPALLERMREAVRRRQVLRQKGRGRKKKKRKKRLPRAPRPRLVSGCCLGLTVGAVPPSVRESFLDVFHTSST